MNRLLGLALLVLSTILVHCKCQTFYIVPANTAERCETEQCYTLDQITTAVRSQSFSDLTLYFLAGKHYLRQSMKITTLNNVSMIGLNSEVEIKMQLKTSLTLTSQTILFKDLTFDKVWAKFQGKIQITEGDKLSMIGCTFKKTEIAIRANNVTMDDCAFYNFTNSLLTGESAVRVTSQYLHITNCDFADNIARIKTLEVKVEYHLSIIQCTFTNNHGGIGIIYDGIARSSALITDCDFIANHGTNSGGAIGIGGIRKKTVATYCQRTSCLINIINCKFIGNQANGFGGAICIWHQMSITIQASTFTRNTAKQGGAIQMLNYGHLEIFNSIFTNNYATHKKSGGVVSTEAVTGSSDTGILTLRNTNFSNNSGSGALTVFGTRASIENTNFTNNRADNRLSILTALASTVTLTQVTFKQNEGYIYTFNSRLDITGQVTLSSNIGGAIRAVQSQVYINSTKYTAIIKNNTAGTGGAIWLRESDLYIKSSTYIAENKAEQFGGGIYAYKSLIYFTSQQDKNRPFPTKRESFIINNFAGHSGGGVYLVASTIKIMRSLVTIGSNAALLSGGGLHLQENSQIYLLKQDREWKEEYNEHVRLDISSNSAAYGGGIYVADNSTVTAGSPQCLEGKLLVHTEETSVSSDCFIQTIKLYRWIIDLPDNFINIFIINNTAQSGPALYGGLLDRCTASTLAEVYEEDLNGLKYIEKTAVISNDSITSDPVRVLFCGKHNYSSVSKKKGEVFKISVSAIDQVGNPVNATIHSTVITQSGVGRLKEGQAEQRVGNQCTELEYNVFSRDSYAQVELYADGPCTNLGISRQTFNVTFLPCTCPIGLEPSQSQIECKCECDKRLQPHHITNCSDKAGTIKLETNLWIEGKRTGYVIHDCPFDYCVQKPVNISLNSSQERDRQCAFNRSGVLCGECQQGLSLVLATSRCKECSNVYLLLLIPFALAGIALVVFILFFNITIATGTIHGLVIYSNLLPVAYFTQPSALTVLISWINLDLGIETCFYNGMSSQAKVLLQLVFPAYLFLLMFLIIILSRYSNFFATLLSNRNPVAALCTLIFMSYSKLVQFIIAAMQSTVLTFPDNSKQTVWLYDANVQYLTPRHTPQFVAAVLTLMAGGLATLLLFFAQWLPRCYKWKLMRWTRNTKYTAFIDAYHAPFTHKHRYWVGLLLFALIIHNVLAAMATNNFLPILSMGCTAIGLLTLKMVVKRVYKSWINDLLETTYLLNLVFLAYGTLYMQNSEANFVTLANVSMGLSACLFLVTLCYHSYKQVYLQSRLYRKYKTQINDFTATVRKNLRQGPKRQEMEELANDRRGTLVTGYTALRSELDVLAPITTDDYRQATPPPNVRTEVTHTVVERIPDSLNTEEQTSKT